MGIIIPKGRHKSKSVQYKSRSGKIYRYRVYKTYRSGRNILVYRTDDLGKATEEALRLVKTSKTAAIVILNQFGYSVKY